MEDELFVDVFHRGGRHHFWIFVAFFLYIVGASRLNSKGRPTAGCMRMCSRRLVDAKDQRCPYLCKNRRFGIGPLHKNRHWRTF